MPEPQPRPGAYERFTSRLTRRVQGTYAGRGSGGEGSPRYTVIDFSHGDTTIMVHRAVDTPGPVVRRRVLGGPSFSISGDVLAVQVSPKPQEEQGGPRPRPQVELDGTAHAVVVSGAVDLTVDTVTGSGMVTENGGLHVTGEGRNISASHAKKVTVDGEVTGKSWLVETEFAFGSDVEDIDSTRSKGTIGGEVAVLQHEGVPQEERGDPEIEVQGGAAVANVTKGHVLFRGPVMSGEVLTPEGWLSADQVTIPSGVTSNITETRNVA